MDTGFLFLDRSEGESLLHMPECVTAMETAFRLQAQKRILLPALMNFPCEDGEFHVKGGGLRLDRTYFALKCNGGFFGNHARFGLPNILGLILLFDGTNGLPLAVMDSTYITAIRTGATTAMAAKYLARQDANTITICGCGQQGEFQLKALAETLPSIDRVFAWDLSRDRVEAFVSRMGNRIKARITAVEELPLATACSDIIVTCTPSERFYLRKDYVRAGTFISAVGSDSPGKQELEPTLVASSKLVVDVLSQCAQAGELHHAIEGGLMSLDEVYGEIGSIVAGVIPGRTNNQEITLFDTTGSGIQDTAAALLVYQKALEQGSGKRLDMFK